MSVVNGKISARLGVKIAQDGRGDLQLALCSSRRDQSWFFVKAPINIYSKHKPFRYGTLVFPDHYDDPNSTRLAALRGTRYGISMNTTPDLTKSEQNPYWEYARPRGGAYNEPFRATDFELYNHRAVSPMRKTGKIYSNGVVSLIFDEIVVQPTDPEYQNVEIQMQDFPDFAAASNIAAVLWDTVAKVGYICITPWLVRELYEGRPIDKAYGYNISIAEVVESNHALEFFWAVVTTTTPPGIDDALSFQRFTSAGTIALMATDAEHGHAVFTVNGFKMSDLYVLNGYRDVTPNGAFVGTSYEFRGASVRLRCSYDWSIKTGIPTEWIVSFGGQDLGPVSWIANEGDFMNGYYEIGIYIGSITKTADQLRDDNYKYPLMIRGRRSGSLAYTTYVSCWYNVQTGELSAT